MTQPNQIELAGAKVLIVDDIPANLKVLREVLEPRGFRILLAPRGDVARRVARSELPDLILLDVMMPEMDGPEVCRRLKGDPVTGHIPVIFITAKDEAEDIVKGLGVGGVDYISKPFQAEVVVARTETHLHNGRLAQALRQRNAELEVARAAAEESKRAQSAFLAMMSHEIRTPTNSVLGMTALLLETPLGAEQRDFVETIRTGSRSLLGIINEILDFSKIDSGRMTLESQPFDLRASVEEVLEILGSKAAEKNLDLAYRPEPGLPALLVGDTTRLRRILMNLTGNALKFTARGEVVVEARRELTTESGSGSGGVRPSSGAERQDRATMCDRFGPSNAAQAAAAEDGCTPPNKKKTVSEPVQVALHFSVRDTGIGIPPDKQDRLFQAFSQMDSSTTRQYGGTGLGLAISKQLAELVFSRWLNDQYRVLANRLAARKAGDERKDSKELSAWPVGTDPEQWLVQLPNEPEWERAARGTDGRRNAWDDQNGRRDESGDPTGFGQRCNWHQTGNGHTSAVGLFPSGHAVIDLKKDQWIADLTGNVWEWTRSLFGKHFERAQYGYPYQPIDGREDPGASVDGMRVLRGGSWYDVNFVDLAASDRSFAPPDYRRDGAFGFRCVWVSSFR